MRQQQHPSHRLIEQQPIRLMVVGGACLMTLAASLAVSAESPGTRRPGEPMVVPMAIAASEAAATRDRVSALARDLGIEGRPAKPRRDFNAADLRVVDETEVLAPDGGILAVVRTEAGSGALRSIVRLDWARGADRAVVDLRSAEEPARRYALDVGLTPPTSTPEVRWDEGMDAWRTHWPRKIDGRAAIGDGLTVWIHRGGQLAALRRSETQAAAVPLAIVEPATAETAVRAWTAQAAIGSVGLEVHVQPDLVWIRPNDFIGRGGADDTEVTLHLAYRIDLAMRLKGGSDHHVALFVDAGSGRLIAGIETA